MRLWVPNVKGESTSIKAHMASVRSVAFSSDATFTMHQLTPRRQEQRKGKLQQVKSSVSRGATSLKVGNHANSLKLQ